MKHLLAAIASVALITAAPAEQPWTSLFDGKTLAGWTGADGKPIKGWEVQPDGVLHFNANGDILLSEREFSSFELEWEWKLEAKGNNGLKYWVTKVAGKEWLGIEYQMIDDNGHPDGLKGGSHNTGSIYDIFDSAKDKALKPIGEWNQSRLVVKDGKIEHWLNGKIAASADTHSPEWAEHLAKSKFKAKPGFAPGKGKFMLTAHGDPAWFRSLRVREL
jgi:hypothetical protein